MALPARTDGTLTAGLALHGVSKRFGATLALDDATCEVRGGTIHALLGENGAGKTTLMRIAFGMLTPDAGEVRLAGRVARFRSSADAVAAGVGMVHQHFMLIPAMTVAENVALGGHGRFDRTAVAELVRRVGRETGLELNPHQRVSELTVSAQQRLEIVKALSRDARVLILDEPTAVLAPTEATELYTWLRTFARGGGTVVLITHRLREALEISDDVTVLRRGRTVLAGPTASLTVGDVITALTGDADVSAREGPARVRDARERGHVLLAATHVSVVDRAGVTRLNDASVEVRSGEVLGVIGVEGSGEHELLRVLAGRLDPTQGDVRRPATVGFVPGDRVHDGLIPEFSLTENFALAGAGSRRGRIDWGAMRDRTAAAIASFGISASGPRQRAAELSGGNQQRFLVAREREHAPLALIAENPARGLDIRAAARVRDELRDAARRGAAVVVYSADIEEVLEVADRVVACHRGRVTEVAAPRDPGDRDPYARALAGVAE